MNTTRHPSPLHRDEALRRLRAITLGAALTGIAAVLGFGGLAAATYAGHASTGAAALQPRTASSGASPAGSSSSAAAGSSNASTGSGLDSGVSGTSGGTPFGTSVLPQITNGLRGSGQVTTGGS